MDANDANCSFLEAMMALSGCFLKCQKRGTRVEAATISGAFAKTPKKMELALIESDLPLVPCYLQWLPLLLPPRTERRALSDCDAHSVAWGCCPR